MVGVIIAGLAGLIVGAAGGYATCRRGVVAAPVHDRQSWQSAGSVPRAADCDPPQASATAGPQKAATAEDRGGKQVRADRERLVEVCADLADRLRDRQPALYKALARDLRSVGVTVEAPDGEPFDAARHHAVGTEPAPDASRHLTIAETMRLGYTDRDAQVRPPEVIVYRSDLLPRPAAHSVAP